MLKTLVTFFQMNVDILNHYSETHIFALKVTCAIVLTIVLLFTTVYLLVDHSDLPENFYQVKKAREAAEKRKRKGKGKKGNNDNAGNDDEKNVGNENPIQQRDRQQIASELMKTLGLEF